MRPIRVTTAADICGVSEEGIALLVAKGKIPRWGSGKGKVRLSDVVEALDLKVCPTCHEPIGRSNPTVEASAATATRRTEP